MVRIAIIANGDLEDLEFHRHIIKKTDKIICADAGANHADILGVIPDYIIGDMDSVRKKVLEKFRKKGTKIMVDPNQDKTDLELAIKFASEKNPEEIIILGAISKRLDHTLANLLCLKKIKCKAKIIDDKNEIITVTDFIDIKGKKDDIISIIALTEVKGLTYQGLRWKVKDLNVKSGWFGICNRLKKDKAKITLKKGEIVVIKAKDD